MKKILPLRGKQTRSAEKEGIKEGDLLKEVFQKVSAKNKGANKGSTVGKAETNEPYIQNRAEWEKRMTGKKNPDVPKKKVQGALRKKSIKIRKNLGSSNRRTLPGRISGGKGCLKQPKHEKKKKGTSPICN